MPLRTRPISPHLQIYRWQMGNTLSIVHRLTGVALALGMLPLSAWFVSLASGERAYGVVMRMLANPVGLLCMFAWSFAFLYHLLNGVRHLFWDVGLGFESKPRQVSGWLVVFGATALTVSLWAWILAGHRS